MKTNDDELWIDIHPHLFNATDLPVRGFVRHVSARRLGPVASVVGTLLEAVGRTFAPSPAQDREDIEELLGRVEAAAPEGAGFDPLWAKIGRGLAMIGEPLRSRLELVQRLDDMYSRSAGGAVDLYVPLAVDMEGGARSLAPASPLDQAELLALISEASLRCKLGIEGVILPMIGFDPGRASNDPRNSLSEIQGRVGTGEFIGVKLYPPMGFRPLGNNHRKDGPFVDRQLRELFEWAASEHVPITAHCSPANTVAGADGFAHPDSWACVLNTYPDLRLNLAHFGGLGRKGWVDAVARTLTADRGERLFSDVSNHDVIRKVPAFEAALATMRDDPDRSGALGRIMFGSDYWFLKMHRGFRQFRQEYAAAMRRVLTGDEYQDFIGGNARRFLGFDQPTNKNRDRVVRRVERIESDPSQWPAALHRVLGRPMVGEPTAPGAT